MAENYFQTYNFWITITKLCLGIICYSLFCHYYDINDLFCNHGSTVEQGRICYLRSQIAVTACVGFTFVIEPAIIIAYTSEAGKHYEKTPLIRVFSLAGFFCYIIGGSIIIVFSPSPYSPGLATGSMFIITGFVYFGHLFYNWYTLMYS